MPHHSARSPARPRFASRPWPVAALCILLALGFCGVAALMLAQLRQDAWTSAHREALNVLGTVSNDVARNVELYDLSLQGVVEGLAMPGLLDTTPEMRKSILFDRAATAKHLGSILVLNEHGVVVEDGGDIPLSPGVLSDREYFQAHRDNPNLGLFISAPYRRYISGNNDLVIGLSRRINHPDGSFAGVVVGMLRIDYFRDLFEKLNLGQRGAIGLFRLDGTVMARAPYDEATIGRSIQGTSVMNQFLSERSGTFPIVSVFDGIPRVSTFSRIGDLPLLLSVAISDADIYATWNVRAAIIGLILVTLCLTMGCLGVTLTRELGRRAKAEQELRASEAQYRLLADHATDVIARFGPGLLCSYVSPSSRVVLGFEPAVLIGTPLAAGIHVDDQARVVAVIQNAQRKGQHCNVTYRAIHRDGYPVWVEGHYSYTEGDGGFSVVLRDVGTRKQAEQALELANAELTRVAATDSLTGLANRRRFDEALSTEWRRAARDQQPLTLLMLDVDRFKLFNDQYGHQAGDHCLRVIARAVAGCAARGGDVVARYGGEELVVLLPETDPINAVLVGERVRKAIADLAVRHDGNTDHGSIVTASIGVATAYPRGLGHIDAALSTPTELVAAADAMLYEAKRQGRNRIATDPGSTLSLEAVWPWVSAANAAVSDLNTAQS